MTSYVDPLADGTVRTLGPADLSIRPADHTLFLTTPSAAMR